MVSTRWFGSALVAVAGLALPALAQLHPHDAGMPEHEHGVEPFDIRLNEDGTPTARTKASLDSFRQSKAWFLRQAAIQTSATRIPDFRVDSNEIFATPHFVRSTLAFLTGPSNDDARTVAVSYVAANPAIFGDVAADLAKSPLIRDYVTDHNGVRHMTFQQMVNGLPVFECTLNANVMSDGRLINAASTFLQAPQGGFETDGFTLSGGEAVVSAMKGCEVTLTTPPTLLEEAVGEAFRQVWVTPDLRSDEAVEARRMYFALDRATVRPAWHVVVPVKGLGHTYDVIIDAGTGELLSRRNRLHFATQPVTMRVYTGDSPAPGSPGRSTPDGGQFPFVPRTLVTINPADIAAYSPDGWVPDGQTFTIGNNVAAHLDIDATPNQPDLPRPSGGVARVFDFTLDPTLAPSTYRDAAVVQLFYYSNLYHDRLYALGFNEAAGNFQTNNFGRGGVGNDAVLADAQDGSGTNNANFGTSVDGTTGRMQMYVFTGATPDRDGTLDGDIVYHELSHGLSIRLHNATLSGTQARGMGEGWSDFFGLCLNAEPTDDPNGVYAVGAYATRELAAGYLDNYYFGIRRFPYSTDMNKAPQTYADIDVAQISFPASAPRSTVIAITANAVHNIGEIWCNSLWDVRALLINRLGFAGNELIMQLAVDGMKLSPSNPDLVQARDGILQADLVNNASANLVDIWTGFAKRGLGSSASSPGATSTTVVEAFDVPQRVVFSYPDGLPDRLSPSSSTSFRVSLTPFNLNIVAGSPSLNYDLGSGVVSSPLTLQADGNYLATLPAAACFSNVGYYVSVNTNLGVRNDPAPATPRRVSVYTGTVMVVNETMETSNPLWTTGPNTATLGLWVRGVPLGTAAQVGADHSESGVNCWFTGQGTSSTNVGEADVDGGLTTLTSPNYTLTGTGDVAVSYWRSYSNSAGSAPYADTFRIEYSINNGATWLPAQTIGPGASGNPDVSVGWRQSSWKLSDIAASGVASNMRLRFIAEDIGSGSIVEAALDDLTIDSVVCVPSTCGTADFDGDGDTGTDSDIEAFFACLAGSCCPTCGSADFDGDGDTGTDADIESFFRVLAGGGC